MATNTATESSTETQAPEAREINRTYRLPTEDTVTADILSEAHEAGREFEMDPSAPPAGYTTVRTTDGLDHIDGLQGYMVSERWSFPFTEHEKEKYHPLEIRHARYGGTLIRSWAYPVESDVVETVDIHFKVAQTPAVLKETPGHMEPQLSTQIRTALRKAEAEAEEEEGR